MIKNQTLKKSKFMVFDFTKSRHKMDKFDKIQGRILSNQITEIEFDRIRNLNELVRAYKMKNSHLSNPSFTYHVTMVQQSTHGKPWFKKRKSLRKEFPSEGFQFICHGEAVDGALPCAEVDQRALGVGGSSHFQVGFDLKKTRKQS